MNTNISHHMTELPHTIGKDASIRKARELMAEFSYHHLPVLNGGQVVGVVTERDLRVAEALRRDETTKVEEVMNDEPLFVERTANIKEVLQTMLKKGYSSVLIRGTKDQPWGVFTTTDAIRLLMALM
jgi:IMP dehydrogenase/acetoin utilization protein AcuB